MKITLEMTGKDKLDEYELFKEQLERLLRDNHYKITVIAEPIDNL